MDRNGWVKSEEGPYRRGAQKNIRHKKKGGDSKEKGEKGRKAGRETDFVFFVVGFAFRAWNSASTELTSTRNRRNRRR